MQNVLFIIVNIYIRAVDRSIRHVSKVIYAFLKNWFMSIGHIKKEIQGSHYFSFFALSNLLTQTCLQFCSLASSLLLILNMQNVYIYNLLLGLSASLCPHTVFLMKPNL